MHVGHQYLSAIYRACMVKMCTMNFTRVILRDLVNVVSRTVVNKESLKSVWDAPSIGIVKKPDY